MKRFRWATTGRFARRADIAAHPDTTVTESGTLASELGRLRWANDSLIAELIGTAGDLENLSRKGGAEHVAGSLRSIAAQARKAAAEHKRPA